MRGGRTSVNGVPGAHLGVTAFGQSGDLASVYRYHGLDADSIVGAALWRIRRRFHRPWRFGRE